MANRKERPPGDDAWAGLDESDDWSAARTASHSRDTDNYADAPSGPSDGAQAASRRPTAGRFALVGKDVHGQPLRYYLGVAPERIGRSHTNSLVLNDASVSREHARIERRGDAVWVVDLGSGNGTFVANKRVDQAEVHVGEEVTFGQVRLKLIDLIGGPADEEVAVPAPSEFAPRAPRAASAGQGAAFFVAKSSAKAAPQNGRKSRNPLARRGGKVALSIVLCAYAALFFYNRHQRQQAFLACEAGLDAFNAGHWDEAEQAFAHALSIVPSHPLARRMGDEVAKVRNDAQRLAEVAAARGAGQLQEARTLLASLGKTALIEEALGQAEALRSQADQSASQIETALEANLGTEARALLARLGSPPPPRVDLEALEAWMAEEKRLAPLMARVRAAPKRPAPATLLRTAQTQPPAMRRAILAFRRSAPENALASAREALGPPRTAAEQELIRALQSFARTYATGLGEHRGKRAFAAIKLLTEAKNQASHIAGPNSGPERAVDTKLADMYYVIGVQALSSNRLAEASEALRTAITLSPGHALSARKMLELEQRAQRLVEQASFLRTSHSERAKELCREVMGSMPPSSRARARAQALLRQL